MSGGRSAKVPDARFVQLDLTTEATRRTGDCADWADLAVCSEVLEHVDDPARLLRSAMQYVAPGGTVVVTVPGGPRTAFDRHIGHRRHYTTDALRAVLDAGRTRGRARARRRFPVLQPVQAARHDAG